MSSIVLLHPAMLSEVINIAKTSSTLHQVHLGSCRLPTAAWDTYKVVLYHPAIDLLLHSPGAYGVCSVAHPHRDASLRKNFCHRHCLAGMLNTTGFKEQPGNSKASDS